MSRVFFALLSIVLANQSYAEEKVVTMDPRDIQINGYVHDKLPVSLLKRIKATTDVFEVVDGVTYESAVDLYKRDLDPESNLVIWEEMARVYKGFCVVRCKTPAERMDVYKALLLRSMFDESETLKRFTPKVISQNEAESIVKQYKLKAKPIDVIEQ